MSTLSHIVRASVCAIVLTIGILQPLAAQEYEVELTPVNSVYSDFGAVRFRDGIVFCSNRTKKKLSFDEDSTNFYTDMFWSRLRANNTWSSPALFADALTGYLNEGPATFNRSQTVIYYTTNFISQRPNRKEKVDEYVLGIKTAQLVNDQWVQADLFPFNSPKTDYNVAHPALSPNDSVLYFASNMPGGQGGMDLYKCLWRNGRWSQPINLGATINTKGDELFPFVSEEGLLYFSSNGRTERGKKNMDVYAADITPTGYKTPYPLPFPMNTEYDDFAYSEFNGPEFGLLSSNRNEERDMIYSFRMNVPNFIDCLENQQQILCYTIEDTRISEIDSLPLVYEWNLGDGNTRRGLSIEHCFEKPGVYDISLSVLDTISGATFFNVSQARLTIPEIHQPFILSSDTVLVDQPMRLFADLETVTEFTVDKHYWIIDHKQVFTGDTLPYTFTTPGYHAVVCGVVGRNKETGKRSKSCSYKEIYVMTDTLPGFPKDDPDPSIEPVMKIKMKQNFDPFLVYRPAELAPTYHIVLAKSSTRMEIRNSYFDERGFEVRETQNSNGDFVYSLLESQDLSRLLPVFQDLQKLGYSESHVAIFNEPQLTGMDWQALYAQEMVPSTTVTPEETAYLKEVESLRQVFNSVEVQQPVMTTSPSSQHVHTAEAATSQAHPAVSETAMNQTATADTGTLEEAMSAEDESQKTPEAITEPLTVSAATSQVLPAVSETEMNQTATADTSSHEDGKSAEDESQNTPEPITEPLTLSSVQSVRGTDTPIQPLKVSENPDAENRSQDTLIKPIPLKDKDLYHVIIIESPIRIPLNDPFFSRVNREIVEFEGMSDGYTYATGLSNQSQNLEHVVTELKLKGYESVRIGAVNATDMSTRILNKGTYIPPGNAEKLNIEFSRLQDIKFEYNSAVILEESKKNLDYITAMLMLEENFELKIAAHTCNIGGRDFNMKLSQERAQSVVDYFVSKGISRDRLISRGYSSDAPLVSNDTEEGRKQNRRVEFTIVFHTK
jgi:outer membrane protein OmpA-like peptidoglycan-associated protein